MLLRTDSGQQRGSFHFYAWTRGDETGCVAQVSDGPGGFPTALVTGPGLKELRLRLRWHQRPEAAVVSAWSRANDRGDPAGEPVEVPVTLQARTRGHGARVWDAVMSADVGEDLFLAAFVSWPDTSGCNGPRTLDKHFHLTSGA